MRIFLFFIKKCSSASACDCILTSGSMCLPVGIKTEMSASPRCRKHTKATKEISTCIVSVRRSTQMFTLLIGASAYHTLIQSCALICKKLQFTYQTQWNQRQRHQRSLHDVWRGTACQQDADACLYSNVGSWMQHLLLTGR